MRIIDAAAVVLGVGLLIGGIGCKGSGDSVTGNNSPIAQAKEKVANAEPTSPKALAALKVLNDNCMPCHSTSRERGGLALDDINGVVKGVVPNDAAKSRIIIRMTGSNGQPTMPPNKPKLSADKVKIVEDWINAGAPVD